MTYFVLNYDSLGYFGGQKSGFGTLLRNRSYIDLHYI